jgi:hypothetical protein
VSANNKEGADLKTFLNAETGGKQNSDIILEQAVDELRGKRPRDRQ